MHTLKIGFLLIVGLLAGCGGSDESVTYQAPVAPTDVQIATNNSEVTLSWPTVAGADSYSIYYSTDPTFNIKNYAVFAKSGWIKNVASPYTVKGLGSCPVYYFKVTAIGKGLESAGSSLLSAVTRYEIIGADGEVVRDNFKNIEWQRCSLGQLWNKTAKTCDGVATRYNTKQTIALYGPDMEGWRVPTEDELLSIMYCDGNAPAYFQSGIHSCAYDVSNVARIPFVVADVFPQTQTERPYQSLGTTGMFGVYYCSVPFGSVGVLEVCGADDGMTRPSDFIRLVRNVSNN